MIAHPFSFAARVAAIGALMCLGFAFASSPSLAVPLPPANFVANNPSPCGTVTITWDFEFGILGYRLFRGGTLLGTFGTQATAYIDIQPDPAGATYCIESFDMAGASPLVCSAVSGLPAILVSPANWYNDVFPSNSGPPAPGTAAFERATAILNTGLNGAACTGLITRPIAPVDVISVSASENPAPINVELVFRIKPGPGNYCVVGVVGSGLSTTVPPAPVCVASAPGDGSFWGSLKIAPGAFATPGAAAMHAAAPSGWDRNVWNSRPCTLLGGAYKTTDFLGVNILPNGLFTPGTNLEYFFRVEYPGGVVRLVPDTNCVIQSASQGSVDGHRWEHFGVLPDSWKDPLYGGTGRACMLVVDYDDTHGDERVWASSADSLGLTPPARWGAGTGWHAAGRSTNSFNPVDIDQPSNNRRSNGTTGFIPANLGQPGGAWDLYKSRGTTYQCGGGGAGALGGRGGSIAAGETPPGPTPDMLRAYYRIIVLMSGDRSSQILGPVPNSSEADVPILEDFLFIPGGTSMPRGLWCIGSGFAQSEAGSHPAFLSNDLRTSLRDGNYRTFSGNPSEAAALQVMLESGAPQSRSVVDLPPAANDVLTPLTAVPAGIAAAFYENVGAGGPYVASVYKPASGGSSNFVTLADGFSLSRVLSGGAVVSFGRLTYIRHVLNDLFFICNPVAEPTLVELPTTSNHATQLSVLGNPSLSGTARIQLTIGNAGRVMVAIYDIAGRKIRTIAEENFREGTHSLEWDGKDQEGRAVAGSVYLVRAQAFDETWAATTKAVILR